MVAVYLWCIFTSLDTPGGLNVLLYVTLRYATCACNPATLLHHGECQCISRPRGLSPGVPTLPRGAALNESDVLITVRIEDYPDCGLLGLWRRGLLAVACTVVLQFRPHLRVTFHRWACQHLRRLELPQAPPPPSAATHPLMRPLVYARHAGKDPSRSISGSRSSGYLHGRHCSSSACSARCRRKDPTYTPAHGQM